MTDKRERRKEIDLLIVTPESVTHDVRGAESGHLQTNGVMGVKCERKPFVERRRSNVWDGWLPATANPNPPRQRGSVWKKRAPRERRARKDVERHELIMRLFSLRGRKKKRLERFHHTWDAEIIKTKNFWCEQKKIVEPSVELSRSSTLSYQLVRNHQRFSDIQLIQNSVLFSFLFRLTPASLLDNESRFETVTQLGHTGKWPSSHLWSMVGTEREKPKNTIEDSCFRYRIKINRGSTEY